MNRKDSVKFDEALTATLELYGKPAPSNTTMKLWWDALKPYPLAVVLHALTQHVRRSEFAPRPRNIIEIIDSQDGRPEGEEAWALALASMDETETVILTEEIMQARNVALPVFNSSDKVATRMTFKEHYETLITAARERQIPVKWIISRGHDADKRTAPLEQAVRLGRLTQQQAKADLPAPEITENGKALAGLITGNVEQTDMHSNSTARERLRKIRQNINRSIEKDLEKEDAARLKREAKRRKAEQHQQQEVEKAEKSQKKARDEDD